MDNTPDLYVLPHTSIASTSSFPNATWQSIAFHVPSLLSIFLLILYSITKMKAHNVVTAAGTSALLLAVGASAEASFQVCDRSAPFVLS